MPDQPNKPGAEHGDTPVPPAHQPAVENQGEVRPDDYPDPAGGDDMGGTDRA